MKRKLSPRLKTAIIYFLISVGCALVFGVLFGLFPSKNLDLLERILRITKLWFMFFSAPFAVGGILVLLTHIEEAQCLIYGSIIYYGSLVGGGLLNKHFLVNTGIGTFVSFVIVTLICYIHWLKKNK